MRFNMDKYVDRFIYITVHIFFTVCMFGLQIPSMISSQSDKNVTIGFILIPVTLIINYLLYTIFTKEAFRND